MAVKHDLKRIADALEVIADVLGRWDNLETLERNYARMVSWQEEQRRRELEDRADADLDAWWQQHFGGLSLEHLWTNCDQEAVPTVESLEKMLDSLRAKLKNWLLQEPGRLLPGPFDLPVRTFFSSYYRHRWETFLAAWRASREAA